MLVDGGDPAGQLRRRQVPQLSRVDLGKRCLRVRTEALNDGGPELVVRAPEVEIVCAYLVGYIRADRRQQVGSLGVVVVNGLGCKN